MTETDSPTVTVDDDARDQWDALDDDLQEQVLTWRDDYRAGDAISAELLATYDDASPAVYDSPADWAQEQYDDATSGLPAIVSGYIDWSLVARDSAWNGEVSFATLPDGRTLAYWPGA